MSVLRNYRALLDFCRAACLRFLTSLALSVGLVATAQALTCSINGTTANAAVVSAQIAGSNTTTGNDPGYCKETSGTGSGEYIYFAASQSSSFGSYVTSLQVSIRSDDTLIPISSYSLSAAPAGSGVVPNGPLMYQLYTFGPTPKTGTYTFTVTYPRGADTYVMTVNVTLFGSSVRINSATVTGGVFNGPRIASITPAAGPLAGGTPFTVSGSRLLGATGITIGGIAATGVSVLNSTTLTGVAPSGTAGAKTVSVTTSEGTGSAASAYTYAGAPTLATASPSTGPLAGGQSVTLTGTNLTGATAVTVGGEAAGIQVVPTATSITIITPPGTAGPKDIIVTTPGGSATLTNGYTYLAAPTLTAVSPDRGPLAGGQSITLTGTNLTGATAVTIGGVAATSVTVVNATTISATTPAGTAGAKDVVVTTPGGSASLTNAYTYVAAPTITAISPATGPTAGGQTVTVTGTNLTGATTLTIGGAAATSVTVVNDTTITAITPPRSVGAKNIVVSAPGGNATLTNGYTYVAAPNFSISPNRGSHAGGAVVAITGSNLSGATAVTFNGVAATSFTVNSASSITATTPPGLTGLRSVVVTTPGGSGNSLFRYEAIVTSVTPATGSVDGGTAITVTGSGFTGVLDMYVDMPDQSSPGGVTSFTVVNDTTITGVTAATPAGTRVLVFRVPYLPNADSIQVTSAQFTHVPTPQIFSVSPNAGPVAGGTTVTLNGDALTGATAVTFGGVAASAFTVNSANSITATAPAGSAGAVDIIVTTPGGSATESNGYTYLAAPTLASISPNAGSPAGGQSVTLTGTNLTGASAVTFDGATAAFSVVNDTTITATTPAGSAGPADVVVTTSGGTATLSAGYTYGVPLLALTAGDLAISGNEGGASWVTTSPTATYTVENTGSDTLTWSATLPAFLSATPLTGTLEPGETAPLAPTPNAAANALSPGVYTGAITVTSNGGTETRNVTLTVGDATAPVLATGPANITVNTAPGSATAVVTYTVPTFTDNVGVTSVTQIAGLPSGASFPVGITTNTFRASDAAGNTTDYSFTVTVGDGEAPVLATGPANITVNTAPGSATAVVTYTAPTFTDNVGVTSITQIAGLPSGASFPVGITTNTFRASDAAGNTTDYSFTVTVADAEPPVLANMPANITISVDFPAISAVATWTPPTATDNAPGVTVTRTAGPAPGSTFPLGATTITYRAADTAGNTSDASFTVTVSQRPPGSVTVVVNSDEDGSFGITSNAPGLSGTIATSGGTGARGPIAMAPGTYSLAFTTPAGFGVASASCTAGGTLNAASQTGTLTIAANANVICTINTVDALGETTAALGSYLETRASLVVQNAPEVSRRLDRLTGGGGAGGGISGFGVSMGAGVLPFSMSLGADEVTFNTSLISASRSGRAGLQPGQPRNSGESIADPLGDRLFGLPGDRLMVSPLEEIRPGSAVAATGDALGAITGGDNDPMAQRFDIWVEGRFARFDAAGGEGTFGILHFGADYLVTPNLLLGVGLQFDWLREDTILGGDIDGQGYLAGPYLTARLSENLYLDLRAAWGTADTDVSPFGTYVDTVESDRSLITGALIGDYRSGAWTIRPEARLTWYREETDAYTDSLNVAIPAIRVETGYLEFGPEFGYVVELADGASLRPNLTLQGVWTFAQDNTAAVPSNAPGLADTGLRGRAELGLAYQSAGFSLAIATYYDGIGDNDFEAWGGRIKFSIGF